MMQRLRKCALISGVFLVGAVATHAQSFYNHGSTVSILAGTIFSVKDSLVNAGTFINDGNLVIGGTWLNDGQYTPGAGEITFNSSSATSPQIINHNNQSFSKLNITGGGRKIILADMTIEDEMILTDGVIEAENNARVIINSTASISGGSDQSHIHAPVYHLGEGVKLYPVGNGSVYLPVTLLNVEGTDANVGLEEHELQGATLQKTASLSEISGTRYWQLDVVSGSVQNSQVILPVQGENVGGSGQQFVVAQAPDITANFETLGQSFFDGTSSSGLVTSREAITQPFLAVGTESADAPIVVYNAVSANGDDLNDYLHIGNIERYPQNNFTLFNRWGDKVFEIANYDNHERVFRGRSNINGGKDLVNGTYYYVLETRKDGLKINGFLTLKK